jgi:hypothetical protein
MRLLPAVGFAEVVQPLRAFIHAHEEVREGDKRLHHRVPRLVLDGAQRIVAAHMRVGAYPARRRGDLVRARRRNQHLRDDVIGLQRDRREHRVELALVVHARLGLRDVDDEHGPNQSGEDGGHELHAVNVGRAPVAVCLNV